MTLQQYNPDYMNRLCIIQYQMIIFVISIAINRYELYYFTCRLLQSFLSKLHNVLYKLQQKLPRKVNWG